MTTDHLITTLEKAKEQNGELTVNDAVYIAKKFAVEKINEISTSELRKSDWSMGPLSGSEVCDAVENQKRKIIEALKDQS